MVPNTNTILLTQIKINIGKSMALQTRYARMLQIFVEAIQQKAKSQNRISNALAALCTIHII